MAKHKLVVIYDDKLDQFATDSTKTKIKNQKVDTALDSLMYACKDLNGGVWAEWL